MGPSRSPALRGVNAGRFTVRQLWVGWKATASPSSWTCVMKRYRIGQSVLCSSCSMMQACADFDSNGKSKKEYESG
jgi:hypothetical protein